MATKITASFQSEDLADIARSRLRSYGLDTRSCRVESMSADGGMRIGYAVNPYSAGYYDVTGNGLGTMNGSSLNEGGLLWNMAAPRAGDYVPEPARGTEVELSVVLPDAQAGVAEGILISCHGSGIRRERSERF